MYEFENIIRQIDSVDVIAPCTNKWFEFGNRISNRIAYDYCILLNPGIYSPEIKSNYDIFFAIAQFPKDLINIEKTKGWKTHCKVKICWMNEMWIRDIEQCKFALKALSQFDYVIFQWIGTIEKIKNIIDTNCVYLPYGIDAITFCPFPDLLPRVIDIYSIGRRSDITHKALLNYANENNLLYVYDTIHGTETIDPDEHRALFINMTKRSKYFVVNRSKINDEEDTGGQIEFGNRFFEGAASGTIMIGEIPKNEKFNEVFNYKDCVINVPYNSENISEVLEELKNQTNRKNEIRKNNIVNSLRRFDWVYNWEQILRIARVDPLPELIKRKNKLHEMATAVERAENI